MTYVPVSAFVTSSSEQRALARNARVSTELRNYSACLDRQKEYQRRILDLNIRVVRNNFSRSRSTLRRCKTALSIGGATCPENGKKPIPPSSPLRNSTNFDQAKRDSLPRAVSSAPLKRFRAATFSNSRCFRMKNCESQNDVTSILALSNGNVTRCGINNNSKLVDRRDSDISTLPSISGMDDNQNIGSTTSCTIDAVQIANEALANMSITQVVSERKVKPATRSRSKQKLKFTTSAPARTRAVTSSGPPEPASIADFNKQSTETSSEGTENDAPEDDKSCSSRSDSPTSKTVVRFEDEAPANQVTDEEPRERQRSKSLPATEILRGFKLPRNLANDSNAIAEYIAKQEPIHRDIRDIEDKTLEEEDSGHDEHAEDLNDQRRDCQSSGNEESDQNDSAADDESEVEERAGQACAEVVESGEILPADDSQGDELKALPALETRGSFSRRQRSKSAFCTTSTIWESIELGRLIEKHGGKASWETLPVYGPEVKPPEYEWEEIKRCRYIRLPKYVEMEDEYREISCIFS